MHHCIQKSRLKILILAILFLAGPAYAQGPKYEVQEISGDFHSWEGVSIGWRPVKKGNVFRNDTLIQSLDKGQIMIKEVGKFQKGSAQTIRLESPGRVIFRLHDALTRKVTLSSNFIKSLAPTLKENDKNKDSLDISSLWDKIASLASLDNSEKGGDNTKVGGIKSKPTASKDAVKQIKVTYPSKGGLFIAVSLPLEIPIQWEEAHLTGSVKNKLEYEVFLKSASDSSYTLVGKTSDTQYSMPLQRFGTYAVRIQTADGRARSEEWHLSISDGLSTDSPLETQNPQN